MRLSHGDTCLHSDRVPDPRLQAAPASADKGGPCEKCDGDHHADRCPHYPKTRSAHKDAWVRHREAEHDGGDDDDCAAPAEPVVVNGRVRWPGVSVVFLFSFLLLVLFSFPFSTFLLVLSFSLLSSHSFSLSLYLYLSLSPA